MTSSSLIPVLITGLICLALIAGSPPLAETPTQNLTTISPGIAGGHNTSAIIPLFDPYVEENFNRSSVPGMAVAIMQNDTVIYLRCFGVQNLTTGEPITPDTWFQLASISKSFTTATIASMVGRGELSWDDPVISLYPDFALSDPWVTSHVTIRDLLSHRTGLPEYGSDELQNDFMYNRSEIIHRLQYLNLTGAFRSSYAYSNIGITSAAEAAANKAGKSWEDLISERIFIPARMYNTSARFDVFVNSASHADTYPTVNKTSVPGPLQNNDVNSPAGGVSSTLNDMIRYARLQLNDGSIDGEQIINATALRETHTPQNIRTFTGTKLLSYGLGWDVVLENGSYRVSHGGDLDSGVSTSITLYPEDKMSLIVLTNSFPAGHVLHTAVTKGWADLYYAGAVSRDWYAETDQVITTSLAPGGQILNPFGIMPPAPADAKPPRILSAYKGSYAQDYYGTIRIVPNKTGLLTYRGQSTKPGFLAPYDGDTFRDTGSETAVVFTITINGTADQAWFHGLDTPGRNGTFNRISS